LASQQTAVLGQPVASGWASGTTSGVVGSSTTMNRTLSAVAPATYGGAAMGGSFTASAGMASQSTSFIGGGVASCNAFSGGSTTSAGYGVSGCASQMNACSGAQCGGFAASTGYGVSGCASQMNACSGSQSAAMSYGTTTTGASRSRASMLTNTLFDMMDQNKDGVITRAEFKNALR